MDMWAFGCMIAAIAFNKYPFFKAHGNINQLLSIVDVLGTEGLYDYAKKYHLTIPPEAEKEMGKKLDRAPPPASSGCHLPAHRGTEEQPVTSV